MKYQIKSENRILPRKHLGFVLVNYDILVSEISANLI